MQHMLLKAATVATDKGIFEAVISTSAPDREKDVVDPNGMVRAIRKWMDIGKRIPLAWNHSGDPDKQIGYIIPESAKAVGTQVVVTGQIDLDSEVGKHAWRLVKAGTLGFSFGYLVLEGTKIKGGGRNITGLDIFEITATPTPMNNDTRVLAFKAMATGASLATLHSMLELAQRYIDTAPDPEDKKDMQTVADSIKELIADKDDDASQSEDNGKALRRLADAVALDHVAGETPEDVSETYTDQDLTHWTSPKPPSTELLGLKVAQVEAQEAEESAKELRARAEEIAANAPEVAPKPAPPAKPTPPDSKALGRQVARLEREEAARAAKALREQAETEAKNAPVPPPEPKPKAKSVAMDAAELSRRLARLEAEEAERARKELRAQAEAEAAKAVIPPPEPVPAPKPEPLDTATLSRKAAQLEQEQAQESMKALRKQADAIADAAPVVSAPEPEPPKLEAPDANEQRRKALEIEREANREANDKRLPELPEPQPEYAILHITHEEMAGLAEGDLKAVWSAAAINNLPDSAFLYIESGGKRDPDGKTIPRSLRHFPYKDGSGKVDLPHLRNALARIPQSNLPPSVKDALTAKAQRILDGQKSVDATDKEHKARSVDPLRARAEAMELEFASDGQSRRKPPHNPVAQKATPSLPVEELRRRTRDEILIALSGVEDL